MCINFNSNGELVLWEEIPLKKKRDNNNKKYAVLNTENYEYSNTEGHNFIKNI